MDRIFEIFIGAGIEIMEKIEEIESASSKMEITGMGADGTPTRYIDKASEDIFLKTVYENDLPYNVVSEEAGFIDRKYNQNLVVDPIDGTFNAHAGIPMYSISIAVAGKTIGDSEKGFVMNLSNGEYFYSDRGRGAFRLDKRIRVSSKSRGYFSLSADYASDPLAKKLIRHATKIRTLGCASLELAILASGGIDMVAYLGSNNLLRNIDVAAGIAIVREAGGTVTERDGSEFDMDLDVRKRKNMMAFSNAELMKVVL